MSRVVTWTPAPGVLFSEPESATNISETISVSVTESAAAVPPAPPPPPTPIAVDHYTATITPVQTNISVATDTVGVYVTAATLAGLFPIRYIDYRKNNQIHRIYDWNDLPAAAWIVAFKPATTSQQTYTLNVTAHLADASTETASYQMIVTHDWTAGKLKLEDEIDARSH